ncbi:MAG: peptidylprolyl isomerase [Ruminococcaceae bacterium]|nr:peptidylprolyl isomerase [Oscillospiraceae bacterium]
MDTQNKVLAVVGGKAITEADVQRTLMNLGQRAQQYNNPQGKQAILDQLINKELIFMDAKKNLLEMDAEYKTELEKLKKELLSNFYVEKFLRDVKVKDEDVKKYFDEHAEEFVAEETVSASHILVETEEKAKEILAKIESGEMSFEDAAKAFSTCPSSQRGGDLGEFGKGQMVPEFDKACFEMEIGELRGPVQTQFGFHLIRLDKKNEAKPVTFEDVKGELSQHLLAEAQQKAYQSKMNQLRILYPVDHSGIL